MIRAVLFDFYNTLGRFDPPREKIQADACAEFGIEVTYEGITRGYALADSFMAQESARQPLWTRSDSARAAFFGEYQRLLLDGAGVEVSHELALQVFTRVRDTPRGYALYDDVLPALRSLKSRGTILGLLTNNRGDVNALCLDMGLFPLLDFAVSSEDVGAGKPDPAIFLEALRRAGTEPRETIHVGDQYDTDVKGAREVGIHPVLLDRDNMKIGDTDCPRILGMGELPSLVEAVGQEA
ncbi:MAG: HAD family hydrolase [Chloroflexota bacterium]|nr:HAD family hydrolase [Chloroflexota bacterium]MDE2942220.1 HAD family hydrolase [Chloroflexota bacterium]